MYPLSCTVVVTGSGWYPSGAACANLGTKQWRMGQSVEVGPSTVGLHQLFLFMFLGIVTGDAFASLDLSLAFLYQKQNIHSISSF